MLLGAPRCSWCALGELLGVRGLPGGPGTLGVPLGALGDPYKLSMLSTLNESERVLVCWIRSLTCGRTP